MRTGQTNRGRGYRSGQKALAAALVATGFGGSVASVAWGIPNRVDYFTNTGAASWSNAGNWSDGVPGPQTLTRITDSATITIDGQEMTNQLAIGTGNFSMPTINLGPGASLTSVGTTTLGGSGASAGSQSNLTTFNQTGGTFTVAGPSNIPLYIGFGGSAAYNMSGGAIQVSGPSYAAPTQLGIFVGVGASGGPASFGTLNLSAGSITCDTLFEVARSSATGVVNMSGGTINIGTDMWIGQNAGVGGVATFNQSSGNVHVGYNAAGQSNYGNLMIGMGNTAATREYYNLSGDAELATQGYVEVGGAYGGLITSTGTGGYGNLVLNGGHLDVGGTNEGVGGALRIGWARGNVISDGAVTVNSGSITMNVPGADIAVGDIEGSGQTGITGEQGVLNVMGGQIFNPLGTVDIGRSGATGTFNLSGGYVQINALTWKDTGNGKNRAFNWTGGTLDVNSANADYVITNGGGELRPGGTNIQTFTTTGTNGSYSQTSGTLSLDVASNSSYDAMDLSGATVGAANLSGGTVAMVAGAFAPAFGTSIPAITAKSITDTATWSTPTLPAGFVWDRRISTDGSNQVETLVAVPSSASTLTASGSNWTSGGWDSGTPNGTDASAKLAGGGGTVTLDQPITLGYLQLDGTGSWNVAGTNTLTFGTSSGAGGIVAFGSTTHTIVTPVNFSGNAEIATQLKSTNVVLSGDVSGSGTVEKTGPGVLTLGSSTSPFTGTWSVDGGTVSIASDANLGAPAASMILSNAAVNSSGAWNSGRSIVLNNNGGTLNLGADSTLTGAISGAGALTKIDQNTLTLSGTNSYSGATNINAGTLLQGVPNAVPANSAVTIATGATFDMGGASGSVLSLSGLGRVVNSGAGLTVGVNAAAANVATFSGTISGGGTLTKSGPGTQVISYPGTGNNLIAVDGNISVQGGTLKIVGLNSGTFDLPMDQHEYTVSSGATLALGGSGNGALVYNAIHGAGAVSLVGGTVELLPLYEANDYTGGTNFTSPTTLQLLDPDSLGQKGSTVHFIENGTADRTSAGKIVFNSGGSFDYPVTVDAYKFAQFDNESGNVVTLNDPISGGGGFQYSGFGEEFDLNAVNTYRGTMNVDPRVMVKLLVDNALPSAAQIAQNGTIDLNGHNLKLGTVISGSSVVSSVTYTGEIKLTEGTLTIGDNSDGSYAGTISGDGALIKTGGGVQTLALAAGLSSTWSGATTIQQGALQITGNLNGLSPNTAVTVDAGADLVFATTAAGNGLSAGNTVSYSGAITGPGEVEIVTADSFALTGSNSYSGGTRLGNGTLTVTQDANLGDPSGKIIFASNGSNPGPILKFGAAFNTTRNLLITTGNSIVNTNGFSVAVGGIDANTNALFPSGNFSKQGAGTLTANYLRVNTGTIAAGGMKIASNGTSSGLSTVTALAITAGASLDLTNNGLIDDYATSSPLTTIKSLISGAYASGLWTGAGLTSSTSAADATSGHPTGLGYGEASTLGVGTFMGTAVDSTAILVRYTYDGDANLNGTVDSSDFAILAANYGMTGQVWSAGDFNYDGTVNALDFNLLATNYGQMLPASAAASAETPMASLGALVPEPTSLGVMLAAAGIVGCRRRRGKGN